jgi:hypothetical protein
VPLSFDESAMDVLDWLERCTFGWDMYVAHGRDTARPHLSGENT